MLARDLPGDSPEEAYMRKRLFAVGIGIGVGVFLVVPSVASARTIHVRQGESIQRAVDRAHRGDKIKVSEGSFRGGVAIKTNDLTLVGAGPLSRSGTVIHPGKHARCKGSGFCVFPGTSGTNIKRFLFRGFKDFGAIAERARNTVFFHDGFVDNGEYGVAAFSSHGTQILHSRAKGAGEAGFYIGDSKHANALLKNDTAKSNGAFGFFLRDSSHGVVTDSEAKDNCLGLGLINTGASGGVRGWGVRDSNFQHNNKSCPPEEGAPPISGTGIALLGAKRNAIHGNAALDNRPSTSGAPFAGGIVIFSSKPLGGTVAAHNVIKRNDAHDNLPADIRWDGKGKGNRFIRNHCDTSQPTGLCH